MKKNSKAMLVSMAAFLVVFYGAKANSETNLLLDQIHKIEFNQCRTAAEQLANILVDVDNHGYKIAWGPDNDDDILVSSVENTWDDGSSSVETGAVAPTTAGDCDGVRTRVLVANGSCSSVANNWGAQRQGTLNSEWVHYEDDYSDYFMLSMGGSCVVKEVERFVGLPMD